jgi:hypothetical protein
MSPLVMKSTGSAREHGRQHAGDSQQHQRLVVVGASTQPNRDADECGEEQHLDHSSACSRERRPANLPLNTAARSGGSFTSWKASRMQSLGGTTPGS